MWLQTRRLLCIVIPWTVRTNKSDIDEIKTTTTIEALVNKQQKENNLRLQFTPWRVMSSCCSSSLEMAHLTENILHPMYLLHELVLLEGAQYAFGLNPVVGEISVQNKYCNFQDSALQIQWACWSPSLKVLLLCAPPSSCRLAGRGCVAETESTITAKNGSQKVYHFVTPQANDGNSSLGKLGWRVLGVVAEFVANHIIGGGCWITHSTAAVCFLYTPTSRKSAAVSMSANNSSPIKLIFDQFLDGIHAFVEVGHCLG